MTWKRLVGDATKVLTDESPPCQMHASASDFEEMAARTAAAFDVPRDMLGERQPPPPATFDAKTTSGPWAYMCDECFRKYGIGLGVGLGQQIIRRKEL